MNQKEMAEYAYSNVPFYQNMRSDLPAAFEQYPIITKEKLLKDQGQNLAPEYMMDYLNGKLELVMTSGSTGKCLEIFWEPLQRMKSMLPLWRLRERYYGITPRDRYCYFFTTKVINGSRLEQQESEFGLGFSKVGLSEEGLYQIYEKMLAYKPVWIFAQPSMMLLLIQAAHTYALPPISSLRYVELTGERIAVGVRKKIEEFFDCRTASQYGCYETNSIAYECPFGHMHIMSSNVYVEVLDEERKAVFGKEGTVCLTSLQNRVMPFVRYRIGDRGILHRAAGCPCGNPAPVIELTKARENDFVINRDGTRIHSDIFVHAVEMINLVQHSIVQYQVIQKDFEEFRVQIVLEEDEDREEMISLFMEAMGEFATGRRFEFDFPKQLFPNEDTGKLAWFRTDVKEVGNYEAENSGNYNGC